jgi:hypothetical protein
MQGVKGRILLVVSQFEMNLSISPYPAQFGSMDKAQRRELLRRRFREIGGLPYQPTGKQRIALTSVPLPKHWAGKPLAVFYGASLCENRTDWISQPDPKPHRSGIRLKRKNGVSALAKIAQKWGTPEWFQKRKIGPSGFGRRI